MFPRAVFSVSQRFSILSVKLSVHVYKFKMQNLATKFVVFKKIEN